ncbi:MAG: hypothetical protein HY290_08710 [Planctomycetia bacterium]|nr:hypothetical protein [Planctomycetia bacterium]
MPKAQHVSNANSPGATLVRDLVDQISDVLQASHEQHQPIELDPHRARLFELFVMAEATGFLEEGGQFDLSCDGVARELAARWNLASSLGGGISQPSSLPPEQLGRLRILWSFMRMWMEWTYAWQRWPEFHQPAAAPRKSKA